MTNYINPFVWVVGYDMLSVVNGHGSTQQPPLVSTHAVIVWQGRLQDTSNGRRVLRAQTRVNTQTPPRLMRQESNLSGMCCLFADELVDKMLKRGSTRLKLPLSSSGVAASFLKNI